MKLTIAALSMALAGMATYLVLTVRGAPAPSAWQPSAVGRNQPTTTTPPSPSTARATAPTHALRLPVTPPPLPESAQRLISDEVPRVHSEADLARYLAELESRARRRGHVTIDDVAPGVRAIRALMSPDDASLREAEFAQRMVELSRTLDGRSEPEPDDLTALADQIARTSGEAARASLVRRYVVAARALPPEQLDEAMAALERLNGR
jgi:hypothetical protein